MQHLNNKFLYENEEILERVTFTKVPIIILWVLAAIITIIIIVVGTINNMIVGTVVPVLVLLILCGIYTVKYLSRELIVTNKRIAFRSGILTTRFLDIPLNKIQSLTCSQAFWQRMFEYGTIIISNSTYGIFGYRFNGIINYESVKTIIMCVLDDYEYMNYECINCNVKSQIAKTHSTIE